MGEKPNGSETFNVADYLADRDGKPVMQVASMPDLLNADPVAVFECNPYRLLLLENPRTIKHSRTGRPGFISYQFSLAILNMATRRLDWCIGIEESSLSGTRMLGVFDTSKFTHSVMDEIGPATREEFLEIAIKLFRKWTGCSTDLVQIA
jgi:hypothetical protein